MMNMKSRFNLKKIVAGTIISGALISASAQAETLLRIATTHAPDQYASQVMDQIKKDLESAGVDLKVKLYKSGQLGSGEQLMGAAARGAIDIVHAFVYSHKNPALEINSLPYLVSSYDEMSRVFSPGSNFYQLFDKNMDKVGLKLLGITGEGFIGVMSSSMPENYATTGSKGQNIRVWSAQAAKLATNDMGYNTTTIDWGDAFPAIQQGVVDGMIGATPEATYTTFREAINHYVPYNAFVENTAYYASKKNWNKKLTEEQRQVISKTFADAAATFVDWSRQNDSAYLQKLESEGVKILPLSNDERSAIAQKIRSETWPKLEKRLGKDVLNQVVADL